MPSSETYECDGCRADRVGMLHCGECPRNADRKREYERKYGSNRRGDLTRRNGYGVNISD